MAALVPEERPDFDRQRRRALADATDSFDLTGVYELLDSWRCRATTTNYLGHNGYREMLARADRILRTGGTYQIRTDRQAAHTTMTT